MISLCLSIPWLPRALCADLKPCDLSHVHFGVFIALALAQFGVGSHVSEAFWVQVRHGLTENLLVPWFLQSFQPLLSHVPRALCAGVFGGYIHW